MIRKIIGVAILAAMIGCASDNQKKAGTEARYSTSDANEIFFKNVRQTEYNKEVMEAAKLDVYRMADRPTDEDLPQVNLAITINWRYDEAYILVEPNGFLASEDSLLVQWQDTVHQTSGMYLFPFGNKDTHYIFATSIYNSLLENHNLLIQKEGEMLPFLRGKNERETFRRTMLDYLRLVDAVR